MHMQDEKSTLETRRSEYVQRNGSRKDQFRWVDWRLCGVAIRMRLCIVPKKTAFMNGCRSR